MSSQKYHYYRYEGVPCRVDASRGDHGGVEIYQLGSGFVEGPAMEVLFEGVAISKAECEAMIVALIREARRDA